MSDYTHQPPLPGMEEWEPLAIYPTPSSIHIHVKGQRLALPREDVDRLIDLLVDESETPRLAETLRGPTVFDEVEDDLSDDDLVGYQDEASRQVFCLYCAPNEAAAALTFGYGTTRYITEVTRRQAVSLAFQDGGRNACTVCTQRLADVDPVVLASVQAKQQASLW